MQSFSLVALKLRPCIDNIGKDRRLLWLRIYIVRFIQALLDQGEQKIIEFGSTSNSNSSDTNTTCFLVGGRGIGRRGMLTKSKGEMRVA